MATEFACVFITWIVLLRYRAGLPGFELPEAIRPAQEKFDSRLATVLDRMADRMEGRKLTQGEDLRRAYAELEKAAKAEQQGQFSQEMQSFLLLSRRVVALADSMENEM